MGWETPVAEGRASHCGDTAPIVQATGGAVMGFSQRDTPLPTRIQGRDGGKEDGRQGGKDLPAWGRGAWRLAGGAVAGGACSRRRYV
jgi:hypothetical protein